MKIHHHIVNHVQKHHKKYIIGAGVVSGMAIFKLIGVIAIFFGIANMGGTTGADYYDTEYYAQKASQELSIKTASQNTGCNISITGSALSGSALSGSDCPTTNK